MMQALLPVLLVGLLSACANIESNKPDIDSRFQNTTFKPLVSPGAVQAPGDWWTGFSSTQLTTLMQQAQADNLNLEATAARLRAAQASLNAAQAGFFPALNLNASRQENTVKGVSIQGQATNNRGLFTSASFSASYEIDLWSRVRNTAQAAELQLQATRYELDAARISIAGQLATTWAQWVAADQTVRLFEDELKSFETNLKLVELRFRQGSAAASDVLQQRQLVESAQGNLSQAISSRDVLLNSLSILVGQPPNTLNLKQEDLPSLPPLPATGFPAELLNRRPDVQQAWSVVLSTDRSVAAAIANRFPQLSLRASFSDQTRDSDLLFDNWVRNLSVNMVAPLFDGGARSAEVERQRALLDQAVAQYQEAAINALADVDNALIQETRQRETAQSIRRQLALAEQSLKRLFAGYRNGSVDYLAILDAQQSTSQLRRNLVNAEQQRVGFRIALYRALSGSIPITTAAEPS
ncbi:TolC family protein [Limnobacter sp.]|uniref:TolC family protein n=1 Tax=Limnobacter sp. TaxID=2003368 RepID=UPI002FE31615